MNEAHPTHVGRKLIHVMESLSRPVRQPDGFLTVPRLAQIEKPKVIRGSGGKLWVFDVYATDPVSIGF